jgi:hypothetical protein
MICGAIFLAGCDSSMSANGVTDQLYEGTWESYPTGKIKVVIKFTFLPNRQCHLVIDNNRKKAAYDKFGTYTLSHNFAIAKFIEAPRKSHQHYGIAINQITPIEQGNLLDFRCIQYIHWDKNGKKIVSKIWGMYGTQTTPYKTPDAGRYTLHRMTSLKDVFSRLLSKI